MKRLVITVREVRGVCPVYKKGDRMVMEGPELKLDESDNVCVHALAPIMHFALALREGAGPKAMGLCRKGGKAYVQCPDPGEPYAEGGTVIFEMEKA